MTSFVLDYDRAEKFGEIYLPRSLIMQNLDRLKHRSAYLRLLLVCTTMGSRKRMTTGKTERDRARGCARASVKLRAIEFNLLVNETSNLKIM